jgi:PAS domain S-box-containing protein
MNTKKVNEGTDLKILVLEDSPGDLELMREQLSNAGYHLDLAHVENEAGFTASLRENSFDLILADYKLPGFDAFGALQISRKLCPETPFICVSGTIGEETAVELLKFGAVDYVLKDKPERLPYAVKRAMEEAEVKADYKKAAEALRESEARFRTIFEIASLGIAQVDPADGKIILVNSYYETITGYSIDELLKMTFVELTHPDDREKDWSIFSKAAREEVEYRNEKRYVKKDGTIVWVCIHIAFIRDEKAIPIRTVAICEDITERKRAETIRQAQYSIAQALLTAKNSGELYDIIKNELNSIIDVTNFFIAGYDEGTGMLKKILDKDEKDEISEWPAEKSATGYVINEGRTVLLKRDDVIQLKREGVIEIVGTPSEAWLGVPLKTEGKVIGAVVVQNYYNPDVYDKYSIEMMELVADLLSLYMGRQRAEEKATKLFRAVEQSSVSVIITNREGVIEYVNPFFTELTDYSFEEAKGKKPNILKSGHQSTAFYQDLWDIMLSGNDWEGEMLNKKKTGELFWEKAIISSIVNNDGVITNFVAIKEDITERKKMLEELIAAKEKAEKSDRLKTAFLQNISHEIRTPLNGILGFGELLSGMDFPSEKAREMLKHVRQSSKRLTETITDYIDMASVVSGTMEVHKKEFPLQPLIEEVIIDVKTMCEEKKIGLKTVLPKQCAGIRLFSDSELIRKTIKILLDNSLKFTSQGEIICGCRVIPEYLEFYLQDTGVGITDDKLEMIFEMFSQADISNTRGYEGSGLGLSIARGLVNLLGGSISVTSERGKGSSFTFTVPYTEKEVAENVPPMEEKNDTVAAKPLILLAEDEESNYLYMEAVLQQAGYEYLLAKNGEEAVALCKQHPEITLVLMDIKMPVMNGVEATSLIRGFRPDVRIIATTAYAQTGDKQRFLAAGCDGYLPKPFSTEKMLALLREHLKL